MMHGVFFKKKPASETQFSFITTIQQRLKIAPQQQLITENFPGCWLAQETKTHTSIVQCRSPRRALIVAWARLDNHDELADKLGLKGTAHTLSATELILHAWLKYSEDCTAHLFGDFSFAIYDCDAHHLFCARDQMGIRPFYYYQDEQLFAFSSALDFFHQLPGISMKPSLDWACKFLLGNLSMDFEKTAYHHVLKCPPAHQISVNQHTEKKQRYFTFHTNKIYLPRSEDYLNYYEAHLDNAIKQRVQVNHPLGSELSGGLDSSTVAAYAIKHYPLPLDQFHTFAFAHFEQEPKQILRLSQEFCIPMTYVCCNYSLFNHEPTRILSTLGAPNQHINAVSHEIFYDMAARLGVKTLLSGFGGDEFVTSIHGYLYQYELLKKHQYLQLLHQLPGNSITRPLRFIKFLLKQRGRTGVQNRAMQDALSKRWETHLVRPDRIEQYHLKTYYDKAAAFDQGYYDLDSFTLENRLAPFISTRTEESSLMANHYGIEYRWPLLDVRLIQCFLSVPTHEKYYRGQGRHLHRRAVANQVPSSICIQNSKYMGERIAQPAPKKMTLNADLHPALFDLIDKNKMLDQESHVIHNSYTLKDLKKMSISRNIERVNQLDHWLKYYFSYHCDWATS